MHAVSTCRALVRTQQTFAAVPIPIAWYTAPTPTFASCAFAPALSAAPATAPCRDGDGSGERLVVVVVLLLWKLSAHTSRPSPSLLSPNPHLQA